MNRHTDNIVWHDSEHGQWVQVSGRPADHLRSYVQDYEGYREIAPTSFRQRLQVPWVGVVLIINFGSGYRLRAGKGPIQERASFLAGLHDVPTLVESQGKQHCIQINLTPLGARRFLGMPMHELANRSIELDNLLDSDARYLIEQLHDAPTWDERFGIIDAVLTARLMRAGMVSPQVAAAWRWLDRSGGQLNIGALAAQVGWSHKHLIAAFREQIGLPPKKVARILRFERATRKIENSAGVCWADIACQCGYYDQAHFIKDFRQFAGVTPNEFLSRRIPGNGGFVGDQDHDEQFQRMPDYDGASDYAPRLVPLR